MTIKMSDVVTVMTITGNEYVGKLLSDPSLASVKLADPRFVTISEQGMGFANGIAMTGMKDPKEVVLHSVLFITETNPDVEAAYRQSVSGLITAPKGKLQF